MTNASATANAFNAYKEAQRIITRDPMQDQIDHYNKLPLPEGTPEHIAKCTERKKLIVQGPYFKVPAWSSMPSFGDVHLEIIKEGITVGQWPLHKWPFVLIGKNPQICEYVMEHPSTSGVHCALVFHGERRQYYIIDLSTNGTQLNGIKLSKGQPTAVSFDSSIVVGLSTRTLVLRKGPMTNAQAKRHEGKNSNLTVPNPIVDGKPTAVAGVVPSNAAIATTPPPDANVLSPQAEAVVAAAPAPAVVAAPAAQEIIFRRHFRHLLIKHVDVEDPVSKAPRNKGEAITRSLADAVELASSLRSVLMSSASCEEATFIEFCQQYSECKTSKKGGDLGIISKGDMDSNFDGPAFRLVPGAVTAPVTTDLGVHLIFRCPE